MGELGRGPSFLRNVTFKGHIDSKKTLECATHFLVLIQSKCLGSLNIILVAIVACRPRTVP